jgi:glucan biosynthesis protein C
VLLTIAFYVVQWQAGVTVKMLAVFTGSLVATLAICELVIRRIGPLRTLFGMKLRARERAAEAQQVAAAEVMPR